MIKLKLGPLLPRSWLAKPASLSPIPSGLSCPCWSDLRHGSGLRQDA